MDKTVQTSSDLIVVKSVVHKHASTSFLRIESTDTKMKYGFYYLPRISLHPMKAISIFLTHFQDASEFLWEVFLHWLLCWEMAGCCLHGMLHLSALPFLPTVSGLKKKRLKGSAPSGGLPCGNLLKGRKLGRLQTDEEMIVQSNPKVIHFGHHIIKLNVRNSQLIQRGEVIIDCLMNWMRMTHKNVLALHPNLPSLSVSFTSVNRAAYVWGSMASHHVRISCPSCPLYTLLC